MPRTAGNSSLFDRLGQDDSSLRSVSREGQSTHRINAIKRNLERMLNARQGCSESSPQDGLSDFNDAALGSTDLLNRISDDIRRAIRHGEPRVVVVDVKALPNIHSPLDLSFRIDCIVPVKERKKVVEIDLIMNAGQFKIV